jgi:hypothetical protein
MPEPIPPAPPRPRRTAPSEAESNAATWIALFGLLLIGGALLGLTVLVLPQFLGVIAVAGGLFAVPIAFHYLVWGWWMSQMKDEYPEDD